MTEDVADQGGNAAKSEGDWDWLDAIKGPLDADFVEASLDQPAVGTEANSVSFDIAPNKTE